ncbi:hypothetical protein F4813DRAFT_112838 [Daldinia decipiens]|uniref:uncharacterized protein n=1 Tax=Daldinia decipiens TaxID=326647 RepID=UPI0020C588A7|nr:uncharacterized protein F4813DRAFT_112838 [Daldinia decipiens]KAI1656840.1 hypothetical protein F4813DRAFT_112838 [Daldinia decipiens]
MHSLLPLALTCWSLLASVTASPFSDLLTPRERRDIQPAPRPIRTRSMIKRDADTTFGFDHDFSDVTLFSGAWAATKGVDISLDLSCSECNTFGTIRASAEFPDDLGDFLHDIKDFNPLNDASLTIGFEGVGATIGIRMAVDGDGQFTIPLFKSETPLGISGPGFQVGVTFNVDLIVSVTAEISTETGFEVTIPDGSSYKIPLDPSIPNTAHFDGAQTTLLPLTVDGPAEITVALRLRVQAGVDLPGNKLFDAQALVGAFLYIPEVTLSEQFSQQFDRNGSITEAGECILPASADININAGVFVDIGADVANNPVVDFNPTLSTTVFTASTSTCFLTATGTPEPTTALGTGKKPVGTGIRTSKVSKTKAPAKPTITRKPLVTGTGSTSLAPPEMTHPASVLACPVPLVTEKHTTTGRYTITECAAQVMNCPASLTQIVVVDDTATLTTTHCPVSATGAPYANATMPLPRGNPIPLNSLTAPVVNTLSIDPLVVVPTATSVQATPRAKKTPEPEPEPEPTPAPAPAPAPAGPAKPAATEPAASDDSDPAPAPPADANNAAQPSVIYKTKTEIITTTRCPDAHTKRASPSLRRRRAIH